jgi:transposase
MRYPDGGGLTPEGRAKREAVRLKAAELFGQDVPSPEVAQRLRVTPQAVNNWRRAWTTGGEAALASKGPGGSPCRLDDTQLARLEAELDRGPAAHGWDEDQRWTLPRVTDLIARLFRVSYTDRGVGYLLHRMGWTPQVPVHRAAKRDDAAIEAWRRERWPRITVMRRPGGAWIVFEDEAGQGLRPPKARTWARRGETPVVSVSGRGTGRVSMAGLVCAKAGERSRMCYRVRVYHRRKGEPKGLSEHDYMQLLRAAHHQLGAPMRVGQRRQAHQQDDAPVHRRARLADRVPATAVCAGAEPDRGRVGQRQGHAGQPRRPWHRPTCRDRQEPAQAHPVPAWPHRRLHRRDRAGPRTPAAVARSLEKPAFPAL